MNRTVASLPLFRAALGTASVLFAAAACVAAQESRPGAPVPPPRVEHLSRRLAQIEAALEAELHVEKNVAAARERWTLDEEEIESAESLLEEFEEAFSDEEQPEGFFENLARDAREALGPERAEGFVGWLQDKGSRARRLTEEKAALEADLEADEERAEAEREAMEEARESMRERLEERLEELGEKMEERAQALEEVMRPEANAEEAREKWDLSDEEFEVVQDLLARFGEAESSEEGRCDPGAVLAEIRSRAAEALGQERGREFGDWLSGKQETVGRLTGEIGAIGGEMGKVGEEIGRLEAEIGRMGEDFGRFEEELGRLGEEMGRIGEEIGRATERIGGIAEEGEEAPAPRARQEARARTLRARRLAESIQREAEEHVRAVLKDLKVDPPCPPCPEAPPAPHAPRAPRAPRPPHGPGPPGQPPDGHGPLSPHPPDAHAPGIGAAPPGTPPLPGQGPGPAPRAFRGRTPGLPAIPDPPGEVDVEIDREGIEASIRAALDQARRAQEEALATLRRTLEEQQVIRADARQQVEAAVRALRESQRAPDEARQESLRRLYEESARRMEGLAGKARAAAEAKMHDVRRALEQVEGLRRGRGLEEEERTRFRTDREREREELRRSREEMERLRRRVEELERRLGERPSPTPAPPRPI